MNIVTLSCIQGAPITDLLRNLDATVTCCHSKTEKLPEIVYQADILVVAVRQPCFVKKEWVKPGAVVIDAGINSIPGDRRENRNNPMDIFLLLFMDQIAFLLESPWTLVFARATVV